MGGITKKEFIKRYGIEKYELLKQKQRKRQNEKYANNAEYREKEKARTRQNRKQRYIDDSEFRENQGIKKREQYVLGGRIDLIEGYDLAKADNFNNWDIHHKLEVREDYINSCNELKMMNLYYNRPPEELMWITRSEHNKIHHKNN